MSWPTLAKARAETPRSLARRCYFVRVTEGHWTRAEAPPAGSIWVTGRIWRMPEAGE